MLSVPENYRLLVRYCIIGTSGALLDFLLYLSFTNILKIDYQLANLLSVSAGIINNFWWNAKCNFKMTDRLMRRLACFYSVGMLGWGISAACLYLLVELAHFSSALAKFITIGIVTIIQFSLNRLVTFRRGKC